MRLAGSRIIRIQCRNCPELSMPFRVTLTKDVETEDDRIFVWKESDFPKGWDIPEGEGLYDDIVYGYCSQHEEKSPKLPTGFTDEELKDLRHYACDDTIG